MSDETDNDTREEDGNPGEQQPISEFIAVPEIFHSFEIDGPFEKCSVCGNHLLEDGTPYLVEKAIEGDEVTFEYAICLPCQMGLASELSQGSMRVLENFFEEQVDAKRRKKDLIDRHGLDHQPWISECLLCKSPWNGCEWKQLIGVCDGPDLLFLDTAPLMLCGHEIERMYHLLSKKTRDRLGDFFDEVIGQPGGSVNIPLIV